MIGASILIDLNNSNDDPSERWISIKIRSGGRLLLNQSFASSSEPITLSTSAEGSYFLIRLDSRSAECISSSRIRTFMICCALFLVSLLQNDLQFLRSQFPFRPVTRTVF